MDFEDWIEIWANAEMKHDWGLVQLVRGQNICKRAGFVGGGIIHFDAMDHSSSLVFPTLPIILVCPFGDERFYYCSLILIW